MKVFDLHCDTATKCYDERAPFVQNGFEISLEQASLFEQIGRASCRERV